MACAFMLFTACFEEPRREHYPSTLAVPVQLPQAQNGTEVTEPWSDWSPRYPGFVVAVESNGTTTFKGNSWPLGSSDPYYAEISARALQQELLALNGPDRVSSPAIDGVRIRADRNSMWGWVAAIIEVLRDPSLKIGSMDLIVMPPATVRHRVRRTFVFPGQLRAITKSDADVATIRLVRHGTNELERFVELVLGKSQHTFRFPKGPRPKSLAAALEYPARVEELWQEIGRAFDGTSVALHFSSDDIEISYLTGLVDLLLTRGDCAIVLPDLDCVIEFNAPPPPEPRVERSQRVPRQSLVLWVIAACSLAALLTFLPLMRRRARKSP